MVVIGIAVFSYRPPLLNRGGRNPKEWLFDHILFSWHYTRSVWFEGVEGEESALPDRALAAWYHPALIEPIFGIPPSDYYSLAGLYESLGCPARAARLFEFDFERGASTPGRARQAILSCAGLGAWEEVERIAGRVASSDFPEGYYWLGRARFELEDCSSSKAETALLQAKNNLPDCADIYYQLGRVYRAMEDYKPAAESFRRAAEISPLHQKAWRALAELRKEPGYLSGPPDASEIADDLLPPLRAWARFGNELVLLGSSLIPPVIHGDDVFGLTLYYQTLPGVDRELLPLIKLKSSRSGKAILLTPVSLPRSPGEEYLVALVKIRVPRDIWPGATELSIGFLDSEGKLLRIFGERSYELPLSPTTVRPRIFRSNSEYCLSKEISADGVIDLGAETVLSGDSGVTIRPDSKIKVSGIGLISSTMDTVPLPEGTEVGRIECRQTDGRSSVLPVRLGRETADAYLDRWPSNITGHPPAEISSSQILREGGREFSAHSYQAVFRFPRPVRLEEIRLSYDYPARGAWMVRCLFLLTDPKKFISGGESESGRYSGTIENSALVDD